MKYLLYVFIMLVSLGCKSQGSTTIADSSKPLKQGRLIYDVSGQSTTYGWGFEVQFDSNNVKINQGYALTASKTFLFDKSNGEVLALINDFSFNQKLKDSYFIYYTPESIERQALSTTYGDTVKTVTKEFKTILGYKCQKTILKLGEQVTVELWTTDKIKTGVTLPGTPLAFEHVALEYEMKMLGQVDVRYVIKSISDTQIPAKEFEHHVPDEYYLVVPASVFSLNERWAKEYKEDKFESFQYPTFKDGRESVKQYIKNGLVTTMSNINKSSITLEFIVTKDGGLDDITIDYGRSSDYAEPIKELLKKMPKWTPGKVKGKAVNSKVTIFI